MTANSSKETPLVSVVTPTFNRASHLAVTVASLMAQTHGDWEAVIVDDNSSPTQFAEIARLCSHDPRIRLMRNPGPHRGACACRNIGFSASSAPFVIFLDSDDALAPDCLEHRVAFLSGRPDLDFAVFPLWNFRRRPGDRTALWNVFDNSDDISRFMGEDSPWQTTGPIWRREALLRIGLWDTRVLSSQDNDLHLRALISGLAYAKVPEPDAYWRLPGKRVTIGSRAERPVYVFNRIRMFLRNGGRLKDADALTPERRRVLAVQIYRHAFRKQLGLVAAIQAWSAAHEGGFLKAYEYWPVLALETINQGFRQLAAKGVVALFTRTADGRALPPLLSRIIAGSLCLPKSIQESDLDGTMRTEVHMIRRLNRLRRLGNRLRASGRLDGSRRRAIAAQYYLFAFQTMPLLGRNQARRIWSVARRQEFITRTECVAGLCLDTAWRLVRRITRLGTDMLFPEASYRGRYGLYHHVEPGIPTATENARTPAPVPLDGYLSSPLPFLGALRRLLRGRDPVIFDIGACEAEDSIRYARLFPSARIFAFEPLPENQAIIRSNLGRYAAPQVRLIPNALSSRAGPATFNVSAGAPPELFAGADWNYGNKSSSLLQPRSPKGMHGWIDFNRSVEVECLTVDQFCAQEKLRGADYLHIDVQGAEFLVLQGAARTIRRAACIWIETADEEVYVGQKTRRVVSRWLRRRGFLCAYRRTNGIESDCLFVNIRQPAALAYWMRQRLRGVAPAPDSP